MTKSFTRLVYIFEVESQFLGVRHLLRDAPSQLLSGCVDYDLIQTVRSFRVKLPGMIFVYCHDDSSHLMVMCCLPQKMFRSGHFVYIGCVHFSRVTNLVTEEVADVDFVGFSSYLSLKFSTRRLI